MAALRLLLETFFLYRPRSIIGFRRSLVRVNRGRGCCASNGSRQKNMSTPSTVDSLAVECHWLRFIRATTTRGKAFPLRVSFLREMAEDQLLFFPGEINLFVLFVEGKVSWITFFYFF